MKNLDRITGMTVRVEFKCAGRIAFTDIAISAADMVSIGARNFIDQKISEFINQHERKPN